MRIFEVGGCVRDELLGVPSKDIDFAVEAESFDAMKEGVEASGLKIVLSTPEFLTIRAVGEFRGHKGGFDFVLARKDSPGSDGRRPDFVEPGTLLDDLARRDFTVNAMAKAADGSIIDPFGGQADLATRTLRFVGDPFERLAEDALRALRAIRFVVTKGFEMAPDTFHALLEMEPETLASVSVERRREELLKCFSHNTLLAAEWFFHWMHEEFTQAVFTDGLWLMPTLRDA